MFSNSQNMIYRRFPAWVRSVFGLLALVFIGLIAYESLIEVSAQPSIQHLDKLVHFVAYSALAGVALPALSRLSPIWICVGVGLFGVGIEIAQGTMGIGRSADILDGVANFSGSFMALVSWAALSKLRQALKS